MFIKSGGLRAAPLNVTPEPPPETSRHHEDHAISRQSGRGSRNSINTHGGTPMRSCRYRRFSCSGTGGAGRCLWLGRLFPQKASQDTSHRHSAPRQHSQSPRGPPDCRQRVQSRKRGPCPLAGRQCPASCREEGHTKGFRRVGFLLRSCGNACRTKMCTAEPPPSPSARQYRRTGRYYFYGLYPRIEQGRNASEHMPARNILPKRGPAQGAHSRTECAAPVPGSH